MARSFTPAPPDATNIVAGFSVGWPPPVDPVELLPPSRRASLFGLRQRAEDLANVLRPLIERLDELRADRHLLIARLKHLKTPRGQGGPGLDDDDVSVIDAKRKLAALDAEMSRLNERVLVHRAHSQNAAASVMNAESWLREGRPGGTVLVEADIPDVASILKRGETVAAALDRIRHRLREFAADAHRVRCAPFPAAHAKARARATIEQLAGRGELDVGPLVEADLDIVFPTTTSRLQLAAVVGETGQQVAGSALGEQVDVLALLAAVLKPALVAHVEAAIDAIADDDAALSREDREQRLAEIDADRLAIERQECALVRAMQADGLPVEHRPDADARAVLAVELQVSTQPPDNRPWGLAARAVQHVIEQR